MTRSLLVSPWGKSVARVLAASLDAVDPEAAVNKYVHRSANKLTIADRYYDLQHFHRILVFGAGKAVYPMTSALTRILADNLTAGLIITKDGYVRSEHDQIVDFSNRVEVVEAGHPIPDQRGVIGTRRIIALLSDIRSDDLVICLISGGGSALMLSPVSDITLDDMGTLTELLLASGTTINEINTLRKHLDSVKGGGLAHMCYPATLATLILSDVIGDPLDVIASGPTVPDFSTYQEAYQVLERYNLQDKSPAPVVRHLHLGLDGQVQETPKPGDPVFNRVQNVIIGNNAQAAGAALQSAQKEGFNAIILTTYLQGEARYIGPTFASIARQIETYDQPIPRPACIIAGGETTVTLRGNGLGGRNQELALSAVPGLAGIPAVALVTLATDGGDGPTGAAGAVVTGDTLDRAREINLDPYEYLSRNDSYNFFDPLDDLIKPGPTLTNVNDLTFLFSFKASDST